MSDLVYAMRQLIRRPGHTFAVVMCLAAGLTVTIATFSIITSLVYGDQPGIIDRQSIIRTSLSYDAPDGQHVSGVSLSLDDFAVLREAGPALGSLAGEAELRIAGVGRHGAIGLAGGFVSGNYFTVLGTLPLAGRFLAESDERPDAPPVVIVSEHFWRTHLDGAPDALGAPILLAGRSFTVIGVAPPRFHGRQPLDLGEDDSHGLQVWMPLQHATLWPGAPSSNEAWLSAIGRLRAGSTALDARAQLARRATQLAAMYPASRANAEVVVRAHGFGPNDTPFEILMIISAMLSMPLAVLAIACANVANLQLARSAERSRELAVRLSLGAKRGQLIRLLTIETLVLVAAAVGVAALSTVVILRLAGPFFPILLSIDWRVAAFSMALMIAVTVATGLAPAWHVMRSFDTARLGQTAHAGGLGHSRLRSALVAGQVALSLLMLSASMVFLRSVNSMQLEVPPALRSQIVVEFDPAQAGGSPAEANRFAEVLQARMKADPRVRAVSLSRSSSIRYGVQDGDRSNDRYVALVEMSTSWLELMDIPVLTGRALNDSDRTGGRNVALVSARLADMIAPGGSPLGQLLFTRDGPTQKIVEIVGVVADNRTRPLQRGERPDPVVYMALPPGTLSAFTIRIGTNLVDAVAADLRTVVRELDPRLPWLSLQRGEEMYLRDAEGIQRMAFAIGSLGLLALALAASGLYAVMGYVVQLRRREIGVRIAIGADPRQIVRMILRQAFGLVLIGGVIGLALAIPLAFGLRAVFVGPISPLDPVAFVPTFMLLLGVALIAAALPARRAARIDPITTLRQD